MTNRELESRYTQMKTSWNHIVNANIELVDDNKMLKEENERLNNIIKEVRDILEPLISLEGTMTSKGMNKLLEILDKGEINE